ncbi:cytochrome P450 monooxygenase [Aspergillus granulosus]|uniref:Cytochrome P450 monooxygenase n=1 Tax=Aspergillus granulosus TaxID=176169 RepID=A0ABR4H0T1_9EURO
MPVKQFYLCGPYASTAVGHIDLDGRFDLPQVKKAVGAHFAIVEPKGISFLLDTSSEAEKPATSNQILKADKPIGILVDGQPVRDAPGPRGILLIGNHERLFSLYGPLFQTTVMGRTVYHTNDPTITSHVFSETEFFTKNINHASALRTFGSKAINHYTPKMQEVMSKAFEVFDELESAGKAWNAYSFMLKLSSQLVGRLILGVDFGHFERVDSPVHEIPLAIVNLLGLNKKRLRDTWHRKSEVGKGEVYLQEAAMKTDSLADYLLRARDSKGNKLREHSRNPALIVTLTAGFVTTSSLLSWLLYGLVTYPEVQERLYQELVDHNVTEDTEMTTDVLEQLEYLDRFIKETQRRHTTSFQPSRTVRKNIILPGGYRVPQDGVVIAEVHHLHNNPAVWDNPSQFSPDRWQTEKAKNRHRAAYIPFAMGPRMCVASHFVAREVKVFIVMLVARYGFTRQGSDIEYDAMFQTVKPNNLYVQARRRRSSEGDAASG